MSRSNRLQGDDLAFGKPPPTKVKKVRKTPTGRPVVSRKTLTKRASKGMSPSHARAWMLGLNIFGLLGVLGLIMWFLVNGGVRAFTENAGGWVVALLLIGVAGAVLWRDIQKIATRSVKD